ncbi:MAG: hypothetical protein UHY68_01460 [Acutalibacteraceae bacterium]|nr:hypothetical protein [Acutalibacteraceae bacterium]
MSIKKTLDLSIKFHETNGKKENECYIIDNRKYDNYIDNKTWSIFINEMKTKYPLAFKEYGKGAGDELGIKKVGKFPPKMASYGSSSRMIYLLSRDIPNFCFEKKLPTTIGGVANMDGFLQNESIQYYIEAKCREPYSSKSYIIDRKYEELYKHIDNDDTVDFNCDITVLDDKKMKVQFKSRGRNLTAFDIKQMISHLLGIATEKLNNPTKDKINFLYLLYNPTNIKIVNSNHQNKIFEAYKKQFDECNSIPFSDLFKVIINYLHSIKMIGTAIDEEITTLKENFSFQLCDQDSYLKIINA